MISKGLSLQKLCANNLLVNGAGAASPPQAAEVETVNDALKHIKTVMVNDGKSSDLYDLLAQTGKDTIDPMPPGVSSHATLHFTKCFSFATLGTYIYGKIAHGYDTVHP